MEEICSANYQIGARCEGDDDPNTTEYIDVDCTCGELSSSKDLTSQKLGVSVFPNPVTDQLRISMDNDSKNKVYEYMLLDPYGKCLSMGKIGSDFVLDVSG